jgi:phosphomannomutase
LSISQSGSTRILVLRVEGRGEGKMIKANIFRPYDVRGVVDQDLTEEAAYRIARAVATQAAARNWHN